MLFNKTKLIATRMYPWMKLPDLTSCILTFNEPLVLVAWYISCRSPRRNSQGNSNPYNLQGTFFWTWEVLASNSWGMEVMWKGAEIFRNTYGYSIDPELIWLVQPFAFHLRLCRKRVNDMVLTRSSRPLGPSKTHRNCCASPVVNPWGQHSHMFFILSIYAL